ncbi:hypothetical protein K432DRAFT_298403, partial [Lepidopterella palustris CBS 459.81]
TWGFVIYRCTYDSDADWEEFMRQLHILFQDVLSVYNGLDMVDSLAQTVFNDKPIFDHATSSAIRQHLKQWAAAAPQQEQGTGPGLFQRYKYCIQVGKQALESVLNGGPPESSTGFVNIIRKDWEPNLDPEEQEPEEELIEGCTQHNAGWMTVSFPNVGVVIYHMFRGEHQWRYEYRRPPQLAPA